MKREVPYIECHGSANRFYMVDAVACAEACTGADFAAWSKGLCRSTAGHADGLLMVVRCGDGYAMRMFNPDGSEAEMCGNGIRCVARLVGERYLAADGFSLWSGGRQYAITREEPVAEGVVTYGADIGVSLRSRDFGFAGDGDFVGRTIPALDSELRFTALNPGNPHITAAVDHIDMQLLGRLGERVKLLTDEFPNGVNVSLFENRGAGRIFVATYERGAGITASCGTAMTSSATAAALLGMVPFGATVEVCNMGGAVRCRPVRTGDGGIVTRLTGNATFEFEGRFTTDGSSIGEVTVDRRFGDETAAYDRFVGSIDKNN